MNNKNEIANNDVMNCTPNKADELFNRLEQYAISHNELNLDVACLICEIEDTKAYISRGFDSFADFGERMFNKGATQMKVYRRVAEKFGSKLKTGEYVIVDRDRVKRYGINALNEIQKIMEAKKCTLLELEESDIVSPTMSVRELKTAVKLAKGIEVKDDTKDEPKDNTPSENTPSEDSIETIQKVEIDKLNSKLDTTKDSLTKLVELCIDKNVSDAEFRKEAKRILSHLEKTFK